MLEVLGFIVMILVGVKRGECVSDWVSFAPKVKIVSPRKQNVAFLPFLCFSAWCVWRMENDPWSSKSENTMGVFRPSVRCVCPATKKVYDMYSSTRVAYGRLLASS